MELIILKIIPRPVTHRRGRLCEVEVSVQEHGDVVLTGLQGDGQGGAAILRATRRTRVSGTTGMGMEAKGVELTLSVRVASQPGTDSSCRTMSTWPCSQAHMSAVEPSSSRTLTCAPHESSARTMSLRPWLTANISAVCPACKTHRDC